MTERRLRLLADSNPMCYGSSTALLAILDHLDAHRTAIGRDVSLEVLEADPAVDATLAVDVKDPDAVRAGVNLSSFDAVLVVSNQSNVEVYRDAGLPVFFVDILYWFGPAKRQAVWTFAEQTFVQNFPGVEARINARSSGRAPLLVGPLIRPPAQPPSGGAVAQGTFASIGGARSRWIQPGVNSNYAADVVTWLNAARAALPSPITLAMGQDAARSAAAEAERCDVETTTLTHPDFLARLATARLYATAPGLNAVFEGLYAGVPMLLLPPQNATQVLQLKRYEEAGLVASGINLAALDPDFPPDAEALSEVELTREVLASLARLGQRPGTAATVATHLVQQLEELPRRQHARSRFVEDLGSLGGRDIAQSIQGWWRTKCSP